MGTRILAVAIAGPTGAPSPANAPGGIYARAALDERTGEVIVKAVNTGASARPVRFALQGARGMKAGGRAIVLGSSDLKAENSLDQPSRIAPVESGLAASTSPEMTFILNQSSVTVLRLPLLLP